MAINVHMFFYKFNAMLQYYDEFKVTLNCLHLKNANAIPKSALAVRLLKLDLDWIKSLYYKLFSVYTNFIVDHQRKTTKQQEHSSDRDYVGTHICDNM